MSATAVSAFATPEALAARLAALEAENAALKARKTRRLTWSVSPKGAVQLNGLRRFPTTLYADEWQQVAEVLPEILQFCKDNAARLKTKGGDED